ncbi:GNAT family N-acetyltransferase [Streptomyces sp. NPDC001401]|uniref:GNAT family N-acetyltransferase n=1 Tax=Streptomyces sp. NPDC001401 TaxID=3364570 RepID=UPI0036BD2DE4
MVGPTSREIAMPAETTKYGPATLRRWRAVDADAVYQLVNESLDHLRPWMPWAAEHSRQQSAEFTVSCERAWTAGTAYTYAILSEGALVGSCGVVRHDQISGMEIGYWLAPPYTGRGLATSAVAALTIQTFSLPDIQCVEILHDEANHPSRAIPQRLGFAQIDIRKGTPQAPAEGGVRVTWRLGRAAFMQRRW